MLYCKRVDGPEVNSHVYCATSEQPPARCYNDTKDGESGNRKLAIGCVFCPYKKKCWADANGGAGLRAFKYSNGVRYLTQVAKTPNVEELEL